MKPFIHVQYIKHDEIVYPSILSEDLITLENSLITDPILLSWLVMAEVNKSGRLVNRVSFDT